jgi:hypothetical protein
MVSYRRETLIPSPDPRDPRPETSEPDSETPNPSSEKPFPRRETSFPRRGKACNALIFNGGHRSMEPGVVATRVTASRSSSSVMDAGRERGHCLIAITLRVACGWLSALRSGSCPPSKKQGGEAAMNEEAEKSLRAPLFPMPQAAHTASEGSADRVRWRIYERKI